MSSSVTDWVESKITPQDGLAVLGRTPEDFLHVQGQKGPPFHVAVIGFREPIQRKFVEPLFSQVTKPQLVVNVPSGTLWTGEAISLIHAAPAAFGTLGDIRRAAQSGNVPAYRNKNWDFFERAIRQHSNVEAVIRVYDEVFDAHRRRGKTLRIAIIDGYHVSAENVRNARDRFGKFDIAVKRNGYGSITAAAEEAADSMGAKAVDFRGLMQCLAK